MGVCVCLGGVTLFLPNAFDFDLRSHNKQQSSALERKPRRFPSRFLFYSVIPIKKRK